VKLYAGIAELLLAPTLKCLSGIHHLVVKNI
jgi:hypothetical protein